MNGGGWEGLNMYCSLSGAPLTLRSDSAAHCSSRQYFCNRPLREVVVAPLAHRTVRWHTRQSGDF
jgi:hypothetical protein